MFVLTQRMSTLVAIRCDFIHYNTDYFRSHTIILTLAMLYATNKPQNSVLSMYMTQVDAFFNSNNSNNSNILFANRSNHNTRKVTQLKARNRLDTREDTVLYG